MSSLELPMMALLLLFGFILWYLYYGLECYSNGGNTQGGTLMTMHVPLLLQEIRWLIPWMNKDDRHPSFPRGFWGLVHFVGTHILVPLGPMIIFLCARQIFANFGFIP